MGRLTNKQARFVEEYLVDLNATQAAIRAGYSQKTAYRIGAELLQKTSVSKSIQDSMQKRSAKTEVTAERILEELSKIAFNDVRSIFDEHGALRRIADLDDNAAACIAGCDIVTVNKGEGEVEHVAKIKMTDKIRALELCGRHIGMFKEEKSGTSVVIINPRGAMGGQE